MNDRSTKRHPDVETLANYTEGLLEASEADETMHHLEACSLCRLEAKRIMRFAEIDSDAALVEEAEWSTAQPRLEQAFRERVLPEVAARDMPVIRDARPFWTRWQIRWLAPVAAAAALILVLQIDRGGAPGGLSDDVGPMRGATTEELAISLEGPSGVIGDMPDSFSWTSTRENDYYKFEIFTSDLSKIYEADEIEELRWIASDSLASLLTYDTIYIWSVTGYKGVDREIVSPNGWFKITQQ